MRQDIVLLKVKDVYINKMSSGVLHLTDVEEMKELIIPIGVSEAYSILFALNGEEPLRPLTHDLMMNVTRAFNVKLNEVLIYTYSDDLYSAVLAWENTDGKMIHIDSRTSDAVAIALRAECPIHITTTLYDEQFQAAGEYKYSDEIEAIKVVEFSIEDLMKQMNDAIVNEEYELAGDLKKLIKKKEDMHARNDRSRGNKY